MFECQKCGKEMVWQSDDEESLWYCLGCDEDSFFQIDDNVYLEFCKRTDKRYQHIRDRHYIPNRGTHGQQIHFMIWYRGNVVGIISGASSVFAVKSRDEFFSIEKDRKLDYYLPAIINNTVFRLEYHEKNLATKVLAKWRKVIAELWEEIYGIPVIGFETFVIENDTRKGTLYKADNWTYVGETYGSTKAHKGLNNPSTRRETEKKMIYCKWTKKQMKPSTKYRSSWKAESPEEKHRAKHIAMLKKKLVGKMF